MTTLKHDLSKGNIFDAERFITDIISKYGIDNLTVGFMMLKRSGIVLDRSTMIKLTKLNKEYKHTLINTIMTNGLANTRFANTLWYKRHYK